MEAAAEAAGLQVPKGGIGDPCSAGGAIYEKHDARIGIDWFLDEYDFIDPYINYFLPDCCGIDLIDR